MTSLNGMLGGDASVTPYPNLLGPQTGAMLLRNIVRLYRNHFVVLIACGLPPAVPYVAAITWLADGDSDTLLYLMLLAYFVAAFVAGGAMTVVISDICLGNRPTVGQAYGRILRHRLWWHMLLAGLLFLLFVYGGLLLLVLPGLWVLGRGFLTSTIVTLEGRKGMGAIRRSFALTKGQAWRIMALSMLPLALSYVLFLLLGLPVIVGATMLSSGTSGFADTVLAPLIYCLYFSLVTGVWGITTVLLYYDQRVRREAYDVQALSEDLAR